MISEVAAAVVTMLPPLAERLLLGVADSVDWISSSVVSLMMLLLEGI
jgi:hypothetical protein